MAAWRWLDAASAKLRTASGRKVAGAELTDEVEFHLDQQTQEYLAEGMSVTEARQRALRTFGNVPLVKEHTQETWGLAWFAFLAEDFRYALRQLRRSYGYAITVILTLALGVGANLAVFQLMHGVLFNQLPIQRPSELYALRTVASPFDSQWFYSLPAYKRLLQATGSAAPVIARSGFGGGVLQASDGSSEEASFQLVSGNFFDVLGLSPSAGRLLHASDDLPNASDTPAVVSYEFAEKYFGSAQAAIGVHASLNRVPLVISGVAPEHFHGVVQGASPDLYFPLPAQSTGHLTTWFDSLGPGFNNNLDAPYANQDSIFWLWVLARVSPAEKKEAASLWTKALQPDLRMLAGANKDPKESERIRTAPVRLIPVPGGEGSLEARYGKPLYLLLGMAGLVLTIGCLNLVNLQLARLSSRARELAVRTALGASRWRVMRQLLAEDLVLIMIGGSLAFATSRVFSSVLLRWASRRQSLMPIDLRFRPETFAVAGGLLAIALVAFSLLPAWHITRRGNRNRRQNDGGQLTTVHVGVRQRWSSVLLACQVCFSLVLLSTATLFATSLRHIQHMDAGLDREHVLSVHLDLVAAGLDSGDNATLNSRILDGLRSLPGVREVAMAYCKFPGCVWNTALHVSGHAELPEARLHGEENHVTRRYFQTLGIPLLAGRLFEQSDTRQTQRVAILNRTFARQLFGDESPIGHYIGYKAAPDDHAFRVIGVVGDTLADGLRLQAPAVAYLALEQGKDAAENIEVRTVGSPADLSDEVRQRLRTIAPTLPISEVVSLNTELDDGIQSEKLLARLTSVFAGLTLSLAVIGFYGLISFHVIRRTSEIGVRIALGSTRSQVHSLFLRHSLRILILGMIPGVILAFFVGRLAETLLYETHATDVPSLLFASVVLLLAGFAASLIPARRAAFLNPVQALRAE